MKKVIKIILGIISLILVIILSMAFCALICAVQDKLLAPENFIMWTYNPPGSYLIFIFGIYFLLAWCYIFSKNFRESIKVIGKKGFYKRYKKAIFAVFILLNVILLYSVVFSASVITDNKIINYTFFSPGGKEYSYRNVVKIDTGVYGKRAFLEHSKGDFYYIIKLDDGTEIDLTETGGTKYDVHPYFLIDKIDGKLVDMNISKESSMKYFEYCTENLDKIYTDKIKSVLVNVK